MLKIRNKLTVLHDNNGVFTDFSNEALDYARDTFTIDLDSSDDYLYVGFYKPINMFYVEHSTANTNTGEFSAEYYNGTTFTDIDDFFDESASFTRSGFLQWERNQLDEAEVEIDGTTLFWYRFRPSVTHSSTIVKGLNIVFSDDLDLKKEVAELASSRFIPAGEGSHILTHVAARDEIIQYLRNSGMFKQDNNTGRVKDITAFDMLNISQIKLPATYLTASKIYSSVSDEVDDSWDRKSMRFNKLYTTAMNGFYLDVDSDDDGISDREEELADFNTVLMRR